MTAGHKILDEDSESRNNHRYPVVVQDLTTQWIQSYPCKQNLGSKQKKFTKVSRADSQAKSHYIGVRGFHARESQKVLERAIVEGGLVSVDAFFLLLHSFFFYSSLTQNRALKSGFL